MTNSVTFAVADFSPIFAEAVARSLREGFELEDAQVSAIAPVAPDAIAKASPEVLIVDPAHAAPLMEFREKMRAARPDMRLVAFASRPSSSLAKYCVDLDFRAFLSKSCPLLTFLRAVDVVHRGGSFIDRDYGRAILVNGSGGERTGRLTQREEDVLRLVARGYSNSGVARKLGLSTKTVDTHRARAMKKLGLADRPALVDLASAAGWIG